MNTRRTFSKFSLCFRCAGAAVSAQRNQEVESQPGHLHEGPTIKVPLPSKPTFFQPAEFQTMEALTERIIPRSDTPGAKEPALLS